MLIILIIYSKMLTLMAGTLNISTKYCRYCYSVLPPSFKHCMYLPFYFPLLLTHSMAPYYIGFLFQCSKSIYLFLQPFCSSSSLSPESLAKSSTIITIDITLWVPLSIWNLLPYSLSPTKPAAFSIV